MSVRRLLWLALIALASTWRPDTGAGLLCLTAAVMPYLPPRPRTTRDTGPALVTALVVAAGWLGVLIYQLIREVASPGGEHLALVCAMIALPVAAAQVGTKDDPPEERVAPLERMLMVTVALLTAQAMVVIAHRHDAGLTDGRIKGVLATLQPIVGAVFLRLALARSLLPLLVRRAGARLCLALAAASMLSAWVHWRTIP